MSERPVRVEVVGRHFPNLPTGKEEQMFQQSPSATDKPFERGSESIEGPSLDRLESRILLAATKLRVLNAAANEGSADAPGRISFVVKRLGDKSGKAKVKYRTMPVVGGNAAVLGADLAFQRGKIKFKPGQKKQTIRIDLIGNDVQENSRNFFVELFKPKNAKLAKQRAIGTIVDDDGALPGITINDIAVVEGNRGTKTVNFTVRLSRVSNQTVTVQYRSQAGSATAPEDYIAVPLQTLTFAPGEFVKKIPVQIVGDTIPAQKLFETFYINLSNPTNATLVRARGEGVIEDNDRPDSRF